MSYTKEQVEEFLQRLYNAKQSNPEAYLPQVWIDIEKQIQTKLKTYQEI